MRHFEYLLRKHKEKIRFPEDVMEIKKHIPELNDLTDQDIQWLYSNWSDDYYCAGWLIISTETLQEFKDYLLEEI